MKITEETYKAYMEGRRDAEKEILLIMVRYLEEHGIEASYEDLKFYLMGNKV